MSDPAATVPADWQNDPVVWSPPAKQQAAPPADWQNDPVVWKPPAAAQPVAPPTGQNGQGQPGIPDAQPQPGPQAPPPQQGAELLRTTDADTQPVAPSEQAAHSLLKHYKTVYGANIPEQKSPHFKAALSLLDKPGAETDPDVVWAKSVAPKVPEFKGGFFGDYPAQPFSDDISESLVLEATNQAEGSDVGSRLIRGVGKRLPFIGGVGKVQESLNTAISAKLLDDPKLDQRTRSGLLANVARSINGMDADERKEFFAKVLDATSEMPAFMIELATTGGLAGGAKKVTEVAVEKAVGKSLAGRVATKVAGGLAKASVQTALNPQMVAENAMRRYAPRYGLNPDDQGKLKLITEESPESFVSALAKGGIDTAIMFGSLHAAGPITEAAGKWLSKIPLPAQAQAVKAAMVNLWMSQPGGTVGGLKKALESGGWSGVTQMMLANRMAELGRAGILGDKLPDYASKEFAKQLGVEAISIAVPEVAMKIAALPDKPSRGQFEKAGGPKGTSGPEREEAVKAYRDSQPPLPTQSEGESNAQQVESPAPGNGNRGTQPEPTVRQEPGATEDVTQAASRLRQDENQGAAGTQEAQQAPQEEAVSKPADRAAAAGRVKFSPTAEWQEVPEGDVLPPGLEIRVDMATGKNYARSPGGVETTPTPAEAPPKAKKPLRQPEPPSVATGASETGEARNPPEAPGTPESTPEEGNVKRFGSVLPNPLVAVMPEGHGHFFRNAWDQIRGMFGSSVAPRLSKLAPNAVIAGQAHAGATTAAEPIIRDWFRKVFGNDWKNEELLAKFSDIQNADNILDIYDQAVKRGDTKGAEAIAAAHDLEELKDTVFRGSMDPKIKNAQEKWKKIVNPELDKWYNQAKRIDPDTPQVGRGRYTGVRINLVTKDRAATWAKPAAGENALPDQSVMGQAASYRNPDVKRDPFMRRAKGTGDYSTDLKTNMLSVVGPRWSQVSKIAFYESLINDGVAIEEPQPPPGGWGVTELSTGKTVNKPLIPEGYKRMPMDMPITDPVTGVTKINERGALYVHPDVWQEVRNILGTEMKDKPFWWAQGLTAIQIASQMDAVSHGLTHMRIIANALAQTSFAGKIPLLDSLVSVKEMVKSATDVLNETPESLERIAKLAKAGNLRPHYETGGFGSKIALGAKFLRTIDTADRVIFDKLYDTLVERGVAKEEGRNEYMQAFGNYNRRMMKVWERTLRDIGASPFLSGGKMAMRLGRKMMTGDPGFKAASWKAVATTRASQLAKVAITYTVMAPLANYLLTGQFGGRPGTPLGAIDLGDDDKGQRKVLDIPQVIGLKRGLRLFGISAMVEGFRQGKNFNQIMGNMVEEIGQTWMHPLVGPGLSGIYAAASGKQAGLRGRMEAEKIPEGGFAQYEENTRAMAESQNPLLYHAGEHMIRMFSGKVGDPNADWTEVPKKGLLRQASRSFGLTTVPQPSDAAETLARTLARGKLGEGLTAAEKAKIETKKPLLKKLKQGEGQDELDDAVQDGKLTHREAANLTRHAGKSDLLWNVQGLSVDEFKMVWDQATPTQKEELRPLAVRRNRLKHSPEEHDTLNSIIDED